MIKNNFFINRDEQNIYLMQEMLKTLPEFCEEFFIGIEQRTTPLTRLGYARDLKIFLEFLIKETRQFAGKTLTSLTKEDLNNITSTHIEKYLSYLTLYKDESGKTFTNGEKAKCRKLSSIRALLKYFFKKEKINKNVASIIDTPKIRESEIIRLEIDEMVKMLDLAETGRGFSKMQQGFHKHTSVRDFAMLSLFLGTGIRISECVGLNKEDIDFENNAFKITRKGGSQVVLYFGDEVKEALEKYLEERNKNKKVLPSENALFLSLQNKRIGVRAVEKLVKKYAAQITPLKHITPHKLRSTYGTNLYRETNDIYVVADVLGHKDVNTTRKHYAALSEDIRRQAANKVKLRKE